MNNANNNIWIFSLGRKGGSVHYATYIINQLNLEKRLNLHVFVSRYCIQDKPNNSISIKTYQNIFEFIKNFFTSLIPLLFRISINAIKGRINVIYFPYFHFWNILIIITARLFKIRVVSTVHDGVLHTGNGKLGEQFLNRFAIANSDCLIFLTKYVETMVSKKITFSCRSFIVPHGLIKPPGINTKIRTLPKKPNILFFGRLSYYKGVDILIDAVNKLEPTIFNKCFIVGDRVDFKKNISFQNDKIEWVSGWVSEKKVAEYFNVSDILVLPYREATQSGVVSIGISASMPMICSNVGGLSDQLTSELEAVFIEPEDSDMLKMAIESLINYPEKYNEISINLHNLQKQLSWEIIAKKISHILTEYSNGK